MFLVVTRIQVLIQFLKEISPAKILFFKLLFTLIAKLIAKLIVNLIVQQK